MSTSIPEIIDTHAHICDAVFDPDRDDMLERARAAGVSAIVAVGEDLSDARRNLAMAEAHPLLKPAAGLYPTHLDPEQAETMTALIRKECNRLIAIGEVGLDYWAVKEDSRKEIQMEIFTTFIELSKELNLPLNVHSRSAGRHAIARLLEQGAVKVQLHAFDGKAGSALAAVEAGYFFSVPPSVVRSRQKQKLVKRLPLKSLLIETDSPVLGPRPDERNEPGNAIISVSAIAGIKGIPKEEVMEAVLENTHRLYGDMMPE